VPGGYLALPDATGANPAAGYLRLAMVPGLATVAEALTRLVDVFPAETQQ
jgi:hypothetical protein